MKEEIFNIIKSKYETSGGNNGVYLTQFNFDKKELIKVLGELFKEKLIKVAFGMHGKMAMLNKRKITFFKLKKKWLFFE